MVKERESSTVPLEVGPPNGMVRPYRAGEFYDIACKVGWSHFLSLTFARFAVSVCGCVGLPAEMSA